MMFQLWENNNARAAPPSEPSFEDDEDEGVPEHVYRLVMSLGEELSGLDLNSANDVNAFMTRKTQESTVDEIVKLHTISTAMKLSGSFDADAFEAVDREVGRILKGVPAGQQKDMLKAARQKRQEELLGELIDASLLDPQGHLFNELIQIHKTS
jgi:hypothetical protein